MQVLNMDHNELPPALEVEDDFLDEFDLDYVTGNSTFCTQVSVMNFLSMMNSM
jgi:hypothetical protein